MVRVPWGVRAGLAVPASRARRFRKATKILLGEIPPLNKDQSKSSSSPTCHHSRSLTMSVRAGITIGSRPWVDGQFARIPPAISLLPQLRWSNGLGAKSYSSITSPESFSRTPCMVCISPLFSGVVSAHATLPCPRRCCQAAAGRGAGSSCGLPCAPSPGSSWDCRRRESRLRNLALTDSQHFCGALFR